MLAAPLARTLAQTIAGSVTGRGNILLEGKRIAWLGDSLFMQNTLVNVHDLNVQTAALWYSNGALDYVSPSGRSALGIAVGGTDAKELKDGQLGVYQLTEAAADPGDAIVLCVGANDTNGPSYTYGQAVFATHFEYAADTLLATGKPLLHVLPIPGGSQATTSGYPGPYDEGLALTTATQLEVMADKSGNIPLDFRGTFGTAAGSSTWQDKTFGWSDGIHWPVAAKLHAGQTIARRFAASRNGPFAWTRGTPVNENPYLTAAGTRQLAFSANPYTSAIVYSARADGQTDERFADVAMAPTVQSIGSGNGLVTYTCQNGSKVIVQHYYNSTSSRTTLEIRTMDCGAFLLVEVLPKHSGSTMQSTAAEVAAAVSAAVSADVLTAVAGGDGSAVITGGTPAKAEIRTPLDVADASSPLSTDYVRGIVELLPNPVTGWTGLAFFEILLRKGSGTPATVASELQTFCSAPWPAPAAGKMIVTTPWIPNSAGNTNFSLRLFGIWWGTLRIARVMIQKTANPLL